MPSCSRVLESTYSSRHPQLLNPFLYELLGHSLDNFPEATSLLTAPHLDDIYLDPLLQTADTNQRIGCGIDV